VDQGRQAGREDDAAAVRKQAAADLGAAGAAGIARDGKVKLAGPTEAVGCTIDGGQEAQTETLFEM
jgi:hypothetical protein